MKRVFLSLLFIISSLLFSFAQRSAVILTAGQSNADGRVPLADLPEELKEYKYCQWSYGSGDFETATGVFSPYSPRVAKPGIEQSWGFDAVVYKRLEQLWQRPFYVIKHTDGGTAIDPSCKSSTHGLFWSADKTFLDSNTSASHGCRSLLPMTVVSVVSRVVDALYRLERDDKNFHVVDASDLPLLRDRLHFNAQGAQTLGQRIYEILKTQ